MFGLLNGLEPGCMGYLRGMPLPSVVVVDDAPEVRALIRRALDLSRRVIVVGEAGDGTTAVDLATTLRPDLMLLDVSMPTMDGLEALPRIRAASPGTRVVMYTGFDEQGLADRARALGAAGYVEKSAPISAVVLTLLAALPKASPAVAEAHPDAHDEESVGQGIDGAMQAPDRAVLTEHLERFREVFEEATIGMATMTLNGHLVRANRALAELLGRPVHQLVGMRYESLAGGEDVLRDPLQTLRAGQKVVQFEHVVPGPDVRVLVTLATVRDSRKRPLYIFVQMQDVTEQLRATEALRQSEERFRLLVEAVQDYAIFMLSPEGVIASWNAGAQRIKGYSAEEIVGRHFRTFYPPDKQAERHPEHELELALREGSYEEEGWRIRQDGTRFWANVLITAVHDEAGVHIGFAKVTRDMTERRQMLDHLEAMNARLARAAQEQSEFLAVTAHELRTPVGVLSGAATLLAAHWPELAEQERTELIESMTSSSARLRRLLDDLLTASRLEAGTIEFHMSPTPVGELVGAAVARAQGSNPEAQIQWAAPPDLLVEADPDRLAQAVDNLISNALRHGSPPVRVAAVAAGAHIEVRITDSGTGPPGHVREQLFQRFTTGARRGTGLGLYIVRELARAHGGDASYEPPTSDHPAGTFVISVPRLTTAERGEPALAATNCPTA